MRLAATALLALAVAPITTAEVTSRARYLMGTVCTVTPAESSEAAFAEAERIERLLSTWREDSELSRLNATGVAERSAELAALLKKVVDLSSRTAGLFNPLVRPLIDAWKTRDAGALPEPAVVHRALGKMSLANIAVDGSTVRLRGGAQIEEGGFGKGYAVDRMLAAAGGSVVIDFGGQIGVRGVSRVAVADPADRDRAVLALTIEDQSLSTSSGSEKTFIVDGRQFSHILDPRNGQALPPRGSVSVLATEALTADVLSTALYVLGEEEGIRWANRNDVAALFISPSGGLRMSAAFRERARDIEVLDPKFKIKD